MRQSFPGVARLAPPLLFAVVLAGCSPSGGAEGGANRRMSQVIPVAAEEVRPRDLARTVTVTGPVEPLRSVVVNALSAGTVVRVLVQEGDRVRAGQLMAEMDGREQAAQYERAKAVLASAEAEFKRAEPLRAKEIISDAELETSRSAYHAARADADLWRTRVGFTRITAPVAGMVTAKHVEQGGAVSANTKLFDLADDARLVVRVQVSELDVVRLSPGSEVAVHLDAYPGAQVEGRIRRVFPSADPTSRLVPVEVVLGSAPRGVVPRPGFLARVDFAIEQRRGVIAVPAAAVGVSEGASFVYVVSADTLLRRPVETGLTASGWVEITRGLAAGERVVSSGHSSLRPGAAVKISGDRL
jgi:membrane fusion protein (multidrug efflux system)